MLAAKAFEDKSIGRNDQKRADEDRQQKRQQQDSERDRQGQEARERVRRDTQEVIGKPTAECVQKYGFMKRRQQEDWQKFGRAWSDDEFVIRFHRAFPECVP